MGPPGLGWREKGSRYEKGVEGTEFFFLNGGKQWKLGNEKNKKGRSMRPGNTFHIFIPVNAEAAGNPPNTMRGGVFAAPPGPDSPGPAPPT